jgi:hypothetical protein
VVEIFFALFVVERLLYTTSQCLCFVLEDDKGAWFTPSSSSLLSLGLNGEKLTLKSLLLLLLCPLQDRNTQLKIQTFLN